jgi:hypothetical protein
MDSYPLVNDKGVMYGVEFENVYISVRDLKKVLSEVSGVASVQAVKGFPWFKEIHLRFRYNGVDGIVYEHFGDNSRYWIVPEDPQQMFSDVQPIALALQRYEPSLSARLSGDLATGKLFSVFWRKIRRRFPNG